MLPHSLNDVAEIAVGVAGEEDAPHILSPLEQGRQADGFDQFPFFWLDVGHVDLG